MASKRVSFGNVIIFTHPIILGDNPGVSSGAPIQIGWEQLGTEKRKLEMFEYTRQKRRRACELKIPVEIRGRMLLRAGCSIEEIGEAAVNASKIRKERADTLQYQGWDRIALAMLPTGRVPKGATVKGVIVNGPAVVDEDKTGNESLKEHRTQSFRRELLQSTGRSLKRLITPVQRKFEASSA
jgi:hypothetical protein